MNDEATVSGRTKHPEEIRPDVVLLKYAALCPECEAIHDTRVSCPYCGTAESVDLKRVLGGPA